MNVTRDRTRRRGPPPVGELLRGEIEGRFSEHRRERARACSILTASDGQRHAETVFRISPDTSPDRESFADDRRLIDSVIDELRAGRRQCSESCKRTHSIGDRETR